MAHCLAPTVSRAQSSFDSPPLPAEVGAPPSAVRGIANPAQVATSPSGAAGLAGAPAATFVAPGSITPAQLAVGAGAPPPVSAAEVPAEAKPIEGSEIVARVEDQVILASDVLWQVNQMIVMQEQASGQKVPPEQLPKIQDMLLRRLVMQLIDTKLLFADFRRTLPPENLEAVNKSIAEPFENVEIPKLIKLFNVKDRIELEAALKPSGASLKEVQKQFTEKTVAGEWLRQKMPKPKPINHEDLLAYYQDHQKEYEFPAQARWEELMVRLDRHGHDRNAAWQALASMGNDVWAAVVANPTLRGPVFGEIAKQRSHGFTAADGGVHDWTTLGSLKCEELNQALATLELGQLSPGIESEYGFHIVRVLERKDAGRTPFTEAQAKIREQLDAEQKEVLLTAELQELRKTARVWTKWDGDLTGERLAEVLGAKQKR
jgi:hypothetical protein